MGVIINIDEALERSVFNILLKPYKVLLNKSVETFEKENVLNYIFKEMDTDRYQEEIRSRRKLGNFEPTTDMGKAKLDSFEEGYGKVFQWVTWKNSYVISKETMEDNQLMTINADTLGFLQGFARTKDTYGFKVLAAGLTGSFQWGTQTFKINSYDTTDGTIDGTKQVLFTNAHRPALSASSADNQSNKFYQTVAAADLTEEKLLEIVGKVEDAMSKYKDDDGNIVYVRPTVIVIPKHYKLRDLFERALNTKLTSKMGDNGINTEYGKWTLVESTTLSQQTGFAASNNAFLMIDPEYNKTWNGGLWFTRIPLTIRSYLDNATEAMVTEGRSRFSANFYDWKYISYVSIPATGTVANATNVALL
ncbi:MAG: hypothetical protein RBR02_06365 [Desulfuromonadaceae bacterium]|nr:hypothetical protein [Desulfuromonadaceae bacterium]